MQLNENKKQYIDNAVVGVQLIAFRELSGKLNTGKLIEKDIESQILVLETSYGKRFVIGYDNVLWVKSPKTRWPQPIYKELKGGK